MKIPRLSLKLLVALAALLPVLGQSESMPPAVAIAGGPPNSIPTPADSTTVPAEARTVLFIGNSFLYGARSPLRYYRSDTVHDLNGYGYGGVPALFEIFAAQAALKFDVSLELSSGKNLDWHVRNKLPVIGKRWDYVVMVGHSLLDPLKPGDPAVYIKSAGTLGELLRSKNPNVDIRLIAPWARPDQVYPEKSHWHGQTIAKAALDLQAGCDATAAAVPSIREVIAVGEAFNRADAEGIAISNPSEGVPRGKVNLWAYDDHHASAHGYYLEALLIFGDLTGFDPRSLGKEELGAFELGISPDQATALQKVAYEQLLAAPQKPVLKPFSPFPQTHWHVPDPLVNEAAP